MTRSQERLRAELTTLGQRREAARAELRETSAAIAKAARRAHKAGLTKREITELAHISRPALDTMLE